MARITVEDCLDQVDNRFRLIHLAAKRVRQLKRDATPLVVCKNKDIVVALREIASGRVFQSGTDGSDREEELWEESPIDMGLEATFDAGADAPVEVTPDEQEEVVVEK